MERCCRKAACGLRLAARPAGPWDGRQLSSLRSLVVCLSTCTCIQSTTKIKVMLRSPTTTIVVNPSATHGMNYKLWSSSQPTGPKRLEPRPNEDEELLKALRICTPAYSYRSQLHELLRLTTCTFCPAFCEIKLTHQKVPSCSSRPKHLKPLSLPACDMSSNIQYLEGARFLLDRIFDGR